MNTPSYYSSACAVDVKRACGLADNDVTKYPTCGDKKC